MCLTDTPYIRYTSRVVKIQFKSILENSYMTNMTFAPGWTQSIDTSNEGQERADLASYISDTFKAINGIRPRWWNLREWSLDDLRAEANTLQDVVGESIMRDRAEEARRQQEMADHDLAVSKAKKPISPTHQPFSNLKELLV